MFEWIVIYLLAGLAVNGVLQARLRKLHADARLSIDTWVAGTILWPVTVIVGIISGGVEVRKAGSDDREDI
jgi:hypothetical protein